MYIIRTGICARGCRRILINMLIRPGLNYTRWFRLKIELFYTGLILHLCPPQKSPHWCIEFTQFCTTNPCTFHRWATWQGAEPAVPAKRSFRPLSTCAQVSTRWAQVDHTKGRCSCAVLHWHGTLATSIYTVPCQTRLSSRCILSARTWPLFYLVTLRWLVCMILFGDCPFRIPGVHWWQTWAAAALSPCSVAKVRFLEIRGTDWRQAYEGTGVLCVLMGVVNEGDQVGYKTTSIIAHWTCGFAWNARGGVCEVSSASQPACSTTANRRTLLLSALLPTSQLVT